MSQPCPTVDACVLGGSHVFPLIGSVAGLHLFGSVVGVSFLWSSGISSLLLGDGDEVMSEELGARSGEFATGEGTTDPSFESAGQQVLDVSTLDAPGGRHQVYGFGEV